MFETQALSQRIRSDAEASLVIGVLAHQARHVVYRTPNTGFTSLRRSRTDIRKFRMIGKASCQVSEALRRSCTKHQEHMAHFQMEVEHTVLNDGAAPQVKFDMAFTHRVSTGLLNPGGPVWFLINSVANEHAETCSNKQAECVVELENSLKRQLEPIMPPGNKKMKKSVRFEPPTIASPPKPCLSLIAASPIILVSILRSIHFPDYNSRTLDLLP